MIIREEKMNFYRVAIDWGKRKKFACGCLEEITEYKRTICSACGEESVTPDYQLLFGDKLWNVKM
jgi:hypothetical protein